MLMKSIFFGIAAGSIAVGIVVLLLLIEQESDKKFSQRAACNHQVRIEQISCIVDNGLHYITVDDSVKVLMYQRYDGVSMIRVK